MGDRLKDKIAIIVGAGQSPGPTPAIGNGRAAAMLFAREGAKVLAVDRHLDAAQETVYLILGEGGEAVAYSANVPIEADMKGMVTACTEQWGRIDVLHNNCLLYTSPSPRDS